MTVDDVFARYDGVASTAIRGLHVPGWDRDDLLQEARVGMMQAFAQWDRARPFGPLAYVAARRRVVDAVKTANRERRVHEAGTLSLDGPAGDGSRVGDFVGVHGTVEDAVAASARLRACLDALCTLTPSERRAVVGVALGVTYGELGGTKKQVDNAVTRGRAKLRAAA